MNEGRVHDISKNEVAAKKRILSFCVLITFLCDISYATICQIIEHPDKTEVVCVGDRQAAVKSKPVIEEQRRTYQPELITPKEPSKVTTVESCNLLQANHYNIEGNNDVEIEVICKISGKALEPVQFILHGLGRDGTILTQAEVGGVLDNTGSAELKTKFIAEYEKFINSHKWEPSKTGGTVFIAKTYLFNEKVAFARIAQLKQEVADRVVEPDIFGDGRSQIILNKGGGFKGVPFNHSAHQKNSTCGACHKNSGSGAIPGFGKDWAHKTCKGCHSDKKQGPTNCKGCHSL